MNLEKRSNKSEDFSDLVEYVHPLESIEKRSNKSEDFSDLVEYVHPLESIEITRATGFTPKATLTEQGELLLEFIRRHLFK